MATGRDRNEPDYLPPTPAEGLEQMAVTPDVITIAQKMKPDSLKKFPGCTTYTPLYYIKNRGGTKYCFRVEVGSNNEMIDVSGKYFAGSVMSVKAKAATKADQMTFF